MARITRGQNIFMLVVATVVVTFSVALTLYMSGSLASFGGGREESSQYRTVTLTDALVECERHARKELGKRLKSLSVDTHSSRFDTMDHRYKVFFIAELYDNNSRKGVAKSFHVNCFSSGERATVAQFKVVEDRDYKPEAIQRQEGGVFGWPL